MGVGVYVGMGVRVKVGVAVLVGVKVGVLVGVTVAVADEVGVLVGVFEELNQAIGFGEPFHTQKKTANPHRRIAPATPMMMKILLGLCWLGLAGTATRPAEASTAG